MLASNCSGSQVQSPPSTPEGEAEAFVVDFHAQLDAAVGDRDRCGEGVGLRRIGQRRHHPDVAADFVVVADMEIMELGAVVISDQPRRLLEMLGREVHRARCRIAEILLAPRDQRLGEQAADRLAAEQAEMAGARGQAEDRDRARGCGAIAGRSGVRRRRNRRRRFGLARWRGRNIKRRRFEHRHAAAVFGVEPAILAPAHRLDRGLAAQHAAAAIGQRTAAEIGHEGLARRASRPDRHARRAGAARRARAAAEDIGVGMELVGAAQIARARHRHGMVPARAALRDDQIVPAVPLVEMRRLGEAERRAGEDVGPLADQPLLFGRIFLQHDACEAIAFGAVVPELVDHIFPPVLVMEQRGIEPARIEMDGIGPVSVDRVAGHEIIVEIAQARPRCPADGGAAIALHIGVGQPEARPVMADVTAPRRRSCRDRRACRAGSRGRAGG